MFKKLFVTAAAAAAVSVPLAGMAWADQPADPGANGNGIGAGGVPKVVGEVADRFGTNPNQGEPLAPGAVFRNLAKEPGNLPDAYRDSLNIYVVPKLGLPPLTTPIRPGLGIKTVTPACGHGKTAPGLPACP